MTAWTVHRIADVLGAPGWFVMQLALALESREVLEIGISLMWPSLRLHLFALDHLSSR